MHSPTTLLLRKTVKESTAYALTIISVGLTGAMVEQSPKGDTGTAGPQSPS